MHNHLNLKQAQKPSQTVLSSHDHKHSIIGGADIHAPTHHLTVNAASCYLILLSVFSSFLRTFFVFSFPPRQHQTHSAVEEDRLVIPQNIPVFTL